MPIDPWHPYTQFTEGALTHQPYLGGAGHCVEALIAIEIVNLINSQAARWWTNIPKYRERGHLFVFNRNCYTRIKTIPATVIGPQTSSATIGDFINKLALQDVIHKRYLEWRFDKETVMQSLEIPLNRAFVLWLSRQIAFELTESIKACSTEGMFNKLHRLGHGHLQTIHQVARQCGLIVNLSEIDRPLSEVDALIRDGILKESEGGVVLTEEGERLAEEFINSLWN